MKHSFPESAKQSYREDCLAFLSGPAGKSLIRPDGLLVGDWCELAGRTGALTLEMLLRERVLYESQFVGVDSDPGIAMEAARTHPAARWRSGSLLEVLPDLEDVCVLNFDSYRECGSAELELDVDGLRSIAGRAVRRFGAFCLFLNTDLDAVRRKKKVPSVALAHQVELVCSALEGWLPGRKLDPNRFAIDYSLLDGKFVGPLGDFYVYRSKTHRMVNMKIVLR